MSQYENSLFHNLMNGEFAAEGDLIQLITDEEDDASSKEA